MADNAKVNILLVDDQPGKLLSYEAILADLDENIIKVESAREALHHLLKTDIAVVLLDVCMPDMDGFELAEMISKHPRCARTAIILVSAICISEFDRLRGFGCGAVDYVPVPVVPAVLRAKVSVFADLYRKTEELSRLNSELEARVRERTSELETSASRLRESEERLNLALDSAGAAPWEWDFSNSEAHWSARFRELHGLSPDEPASLETVLARVYPEDRERLVNRINRLRSGSEDDSWNEEFRILDPVHGLRWLSGRGKLTRDAEGRPVRLTGIDLDITDRKRSEEFRAQLLKSEQEARAAAEETNRLKNEFIATLSHELRTPINAVLGWVQLMKRSGLNSADYHEGLRVIERGIRTQVRLIDELLDVNRIDSGKLRISQASILLADVLRGAVETVKLDAHDKGVHVALAGDAGETRLYGDATRLQQVFWNLLTNSIKFTPGGGQVTIQVTPFDRHVEIVVSDTGQGIPPELLPHIFERFRQGDGSTTRKHGGLGLGLSIAKYIIEMHGGSIVAESDGNGCGARFVLRLPIHIVPVELDPPNNKSEPALDINLKGVRILIVDDDDASRDIVARALSGYSAITRTEPGAREALAALIKWNPDILISDIAMPEMDGYSLLREVRTTHGNTDIPAIALTAYARPEDRARALAAGFTAYVAKPIDPGFLVALVSKLVRREHVEQKTS